MRTSGFVGLIIAGLCWPSLVHESNGVAQPPGATLAGASEAPADLASVMARVHYAFRPDGGSWAARHSTYGVTLHEGGVLEFLPGARDGSPVRFGPARIERGGAVLAVGEGVAALGDQGQLEVARGGLVETLRNGSAGVEQSWRLGDRPPGRDDLEVRIALAEGRFVAETEAGLHFTGGAQGVRYGHATWIDAAGVATDVPSRWNGSAIVLRVPADVVDRSIYPAVLDPVIGPERALDVPVYEAALGDQRSASVACGVASCLAVWSDGRRSYGLSNEVDLFGARIATDGSVLDPAGILVATNIAGAPVAAWDGTNWLVAWSVGGIATGGATRAARVRGSDGAVLDPAGILVSVGAGSQITPAISWSGTSYMVAWADARGGAGYDIYGARVRASDGVVLDPAGIALTTAPGEQLWPAVAWSGTSFLVVWGDRRSTTRWDIYGARVGASDGAVLDPAGIAISTAGNAQSPALAWDGANYLVVWDDSRNVPGFDIYGARVRGSDGAVLDPAGKPISTAAGDQRYPTVAWDGTLYLVAWTDTRSGAGYDIYGVRVRASDAAVLDAADLAIATEAHDQYFPKAAWDGTHLLVVWVDERSGAGADIFGARMSGADGSVLDAAGILVSTGAVGQWVPAVAWDGTNYLLVWTTYRVASGDDIMGVRIRGSDGTVLDPSGITISSAPGDQATPAVAWDGTEYLVVWRDRRGGVDEDVYGARVQGSDGVVLDPAGVPVSTAPGDQVQPAVTWDGTQFLVVWMDRRSGTSSDVYGARVRGSDGAVLDASGIPISAAANDEAQPAVAAAAGVALVVWQDGRSGIGDEIYGARVRASDGNVLDAHGIAVSTPGIYDATPAVASSGTDFLVAWSDGRGGIYGARVQGAGGNVLDPAGIPISMPGGMGQYEPEVTWDGTNYLVAWSDGRSGTTLNIYGARVSTEGTAGDAGGFAISTAPQNERFVAMTAVGPGDVLVAYQREPGWIYTRRIDSRNRAPALTGGAPVTTPEDVAVDVPLSASDPDGDPLGWVIVTPPAHGTVAGAAPTYTPAPDFNGSDSFVIAATDGLLRSPSATVSVTVTPVNDPPVAQDRSATTHRSNPVAVTLVAADVDGDPLTYAVVTPPTAGTLAGAPPLLTYTASSSHASGTDTFTYRASDGAAVSNLATVTVTVTNAAPVASDQSVTVAGGATVAITLAALDPDGDTVGYSIVAPPAHGALSGSGATRTYASAPGFSGTDSFTFSANDGALDSNVATVTVVVTAATATAGSSSGCGCTSGGDVAPAGLLLLALLALPRRRPHRRPDAGVPG